MMREDAIAAEHVAAADRDQSNGLNPVEQILPHYESIGIRRSCAFTLDVDIARIVHVTAETGMRFEPASVG